MMVWRKSRRERKDGLIVVLQLAIANATGLFDAKALGLVYFVVAVRTLIEIHLTIALEGQNMRADSVEEPAVVANHHSAASKLL